MIFLRGITTLYVIFLAIYLFLRFTFGDAFWWLSLFNTFALLWFIPLPLALLIIWLQKIRWIRWLSLGVSLVTLLWFGSYFLPKPQPKVTGQRFTLLSYNMQSKPEGLETLLRSRTIDLVFLQEIPPEFIQFLNALKDLNPYHFSQDQQWENAVLSIYPIRKSETLPGLENNRFQRFELDINGNRVAIYNVHPTWPIGPVRWKIPFVSHFAFDQIFGFDHSLRNTQINLLIEYLEQENLPYIVAGDFNLSQYTETYSKLSKKSIDSFRETEIGFGNTWPASRLGNFKIPPLLRLDYIWHSQQFQAIRVERQEKLKSDHFPIIVELVLIEP